MNKSENTKNKNDSKENRKEDSQELHFEGGEIDFTEELTNKDKNKEINQPQLQEEDKDRSSEEADKKSIYIKNVDFSTTPEELEEHFKKCGDINRITILCDKYTGVPKGYAYIEFNSVESKEKSKGLNDSLFKGRQIKIDDKRKNIPHFFGKTKNFKLPPGFMNPPIMMRGRGFFGGRAPRGGGRGGRFRRGFKPY